MMRTATEAFYCSVGSQKVVARSLIESHYRACLYAGVMIGGINSEVPQALESSDDAVVSASRSSTISTMLIVIIMDDHASSSFHIW